MTKFIPYWWDDQPQFENKKELPSSADVVVIGAGYTGLSAALTLSKAGKSVIVLDSEAIGYGASTRNGGMLGSGHKVSTDEAIRQYGQEIASQLHQEANASLAFTTNLIQENNIECELQLCGRLRTAWSPKDQIDMSKNLKILQSIENFNSNMIEYEKMSQSIKTDLYFGGQLYQDHGAVQPRKFHYGLLQLAIKAGANIYGKSHVIEVEHNLKSKNRTFKVSTEKSSISCENILMATNGYTRNSLSKIFSKAGSSCS